MGKPKTTSKKGHFVSLGKGNHPSLEKKLKKRIEREMGKQPKVIVTVFKL